MSGRHKHSRVELVGSSPMRHSDVATQRASGCGLAGARVPQPVLEAAGARDRLAADKPQFRPLPQASGPDVRPCCVVLRRCLALESYALWSDCATWSLAGASFVQPSPIVLADPLHQNRSHRLCNFCDRSSCPLRLRLHPSEPALTTYKAFPARCPSNKTAKMFMARSEYGTLNQSQNRRVRGFG